MEAGRAVVEVESNMTEDSEPEPADVVESAAMDPMSRDETKAVVELESLSGALAEMSELGPGVEFFDR